MKINGTNNIGVNEGRHICMYIYMNIYIYIDVVYVCFYYLCIYETCRYFLLCSV